MTTKIGDKIIMEKELKRELFNIYDLIILEDENGITQDCVCVIGKAKEVDKLVDIIECINHNISIYEDGNYKVWESDGKDKPYYATNKKIIHLYTLKNDNRYYEIYPSDDYGLLGHTDHNDSLDKLLDRANHDEYLDRIGTEEAVKFLNENQMSAKSIQSDLQRLGKIDKAIAICKKANKQKYVYIKESYGISKEKFLDDLDYEVLNNRLYVSSRGMYYDFPLKDYGIWWALTKEELEHE